MQIGAQNRDDLGLQSVALIMAGVVAFRQIFQTWVLLPTPSRRPSTRSVLQGRASRARKLVHEVAGHAHSGCAAKCGHGMLSSWVALSSVFRSW